MKNTNTLNFEVIPGKKPTSPKQIAANRANAQKNTGPKTPGGKAVSCQNATTHGITSQTTVMTEEDRVRHDIFCEAMMNDFAPVGPMETFLASSIAEEAWRLNHARAQCNNIIAIGHFDGTGDQYSADHPEVHTAITAATTVRNNATTLERLSLYEQRIHRAFQKYSDQLAKLQAERKAKREQEFEQARLLMQLAEQKHLPFNLAENGFVFSFPELKSHSERHHSLYQAKTEDFTWRESHGFTSLPKSA